MSLLREAGGFPNRSVVEYATIKVRLPHGALPTNLQEHGHCVADDEIATVYVSPKGRLTHTPTYLNQQTLADAFCAHLRRVFTKRSYSHCYIMEVEIGTSTWTKRITKAKEKDSAAVKAVLTKTVLPLLNR